MTAPALARGKTGRRYVWPPGTDKPELVIPSVTTILGQLAKPALVNWSAKEVAIYAVEHLLTWQDLPTDDAIDLLKRAPYRNMTRRGEIGTAVHAAIESWSGGEPVVEDLDLLPYIGAATAYFEDHVEKLLEAEATIFNRTFRYAGTCDAIVALKDGRNAIIDYKTGKGVYSEAALQLCAYSRGEFIGDEHGESRVLPQIDVGMVIHLPGDGSYKAHEVELTDRQWKTFLAARTLQKWADDHAADALGKVIKGSAKQADTTKEA